MVWRNNVWMAALLGAAVVGGCEQAEEKPAEAPAGQTEKVGVTAAAGEGGGKQEKVEPSVGRGRVTTVAGEPIAGAVVTLENTLFYRSSAEVRTGADGTYRVEVPKGSWHTTAKLDRTYHGRPYRFDLAPENPDDFAGADGGVRNFVWKLTGERPDGLGTYGEKVVAYSEPGDYSFELGDVELTLVPEGALVDGSTGRTIQGKLVSTGDGMAVQDVPMGRYRISARLAAKGKPEEALLVRVRSKGDFGASVTADFETPHGPTLAIHRLEVEVKKP